MNKVGYTVSLSEPGEHFGNFPQRPGTSHLPPGILDKVLKLPASPAKGKARPPSPGIRLSKRRHPPSWPAFSSAVTRQRAGCVQHQATSQPLQAPGDLPAPPGATLWAAPFHSQGHRLREGAAWPGSQREPQAGGPGPAHTGSFSPGASASAAGCGKQSTCAWGTGTTPRNHLEIS